MRTNHLRGLRSSAAALAVFAGPATAPALVDINNSVEAMAKAFEEFKSANDARLKEIEKTGSASAEAVAKVEKINAEMSSIQSKLDEFAKQLGRITIGGGGSADEVAAETKAARRFYIEAMTSRGVSVKDAVAQLKKDAPDLDAYRGYRDAFDAAIQCGMNVDMLPTDIRNALSVGADPTGGYLIPPERTTEFVTRIFETSPMRQVANVRTIGSDAWEQPKDVNDGVSGGWVGEKQTRPATGTPDVGMQRIPVYEQYAYPELTQKMLEDAGIIDVGAWLEEKTADKMVRTENTGFVSGNGVVKPTGFLDYATAATTADDKTGRAWGILQYLPLGGTAGFPLLSSGASNPDALITIVQSLKAAYRARATWMMNRNTVGIIRKLKDRDGNYMWTMGDIRSGQPQSLHGYGITEAEDMPDFASGAVPLAFGDWKQGYTIVDRLGLSVLRDPYTNKPYVGFYIRKRTGGDVTNFDAIKLGKASVS
jgi:HK97 family phage major capsid protein